MCKPFGKRCEMHCFDLFHVRMRAHFKRLRILPIHTRTHTTIINTLTHSHFLSVPRCRDFFKAHAHAFALHRSYGYCLSIEWVERGSVMCLCLPHNSCACACVRSWWAYAAICGHHVRYEAEFKDIGWCSLCGPIVKKKKKTDALCWTLFSLVISREWRMVYEKEKKHTHFRASRHDGSIGTFV